MLDILYIINFQKKPLKSTHPHPDEHYKHNDQYLRFTAGDEEILLDLYERPPHQVFIRNTLMVDFYEKLVLILFKTLS